MLNKIADAVERIAGYADVTPCTRSEYLSEITGGDIFIKQEQQQVSGSFKIRGVLNKVVKAIDKDREKPFVAASTGNHGIAFAHVMELFGLNGAVWVPETISPAKLSVLESKSVEVRLWGKNCIDAEIKARSEAEKMGAVFVHPYNDSDVIAGQGTIGNEVLDQIGNPDYLLVPVGGGGLISGIASSLHSVGASSVVIGCQPVNSQVMNLSLKAGKTIQAEEKDTVSDATAGGVEKDSLTFDICEKLVSEIFLLEEKEILKALREIWLNENILLEGGAALPVAAVVKYREFFKNRRVVLVTTGGRVVDELRHYIVGGSE